MLTDILYAEINLIGIVLLLLFLNNMNKNSRKNTPVDQRIFNGCMVINILIFVFDTGMWLFDGNQIEVLRTGNYIVTMLYYVCNPLICFWWLMYTDYKVHESRSDLLKRIRIYAIPCAVSTVLSMVSLYTGWFFIIDENNNYMRGPYFFVMAVISLLYLIFSFGMALKDVIKNGWGENKSINLHLVIFPIGIFLATAIQIMFFGVSIIWVCSMLAFASIYINIQNGEISTDHLTGLYNRRRFDEHLKRRLKVQKKGQHMFAIIMDLDDFKNINDKYGHLAGDNALARVAELLRNNCKDSDDFVARLGGDEFIIVGERTDTADIQKLLDRISKDVISYNNRSELDFPIKLSMGYAVLEKNGTRSSLLAAADRAMYRNKQERKSLND
ncbi:MAG: diguanylate cyclase [Eubacteriales bacterium]|nr:diguanylate cyclase [Eubacteriales bacterium]